MRQDQEAYQAAYGAAFEQADAIEDQAYRADLYERALKAGDQAYIDQPDIDQDQNQASAEIDDLMARGIGAAVGLGRAPDRIEAHCWFNIAASRGSRHAMRLRQELAQEMSADEIAHAQRRARAYLAPKTSAAA